MSVAQIINADFRKRCFTTHRESANWLVSRCDFCSWEHSYMTVASMVAVEGFLCRHLVLCHVDIGEMIVNYQ